MGYIFASVAGALMSIQGVMNTRLSSKIGLYESNAFVQGTAFVASVIALLFMKNGNWANIKEVNKLYLLGGILGLVITVTVMLSMKNLSPALAVSTILISQLLVAAIIDAFGIMDSEKISFGWNKYVALVMLIGGVILFKADFTK